MQSNLSHPKYRPDIDGLRAIAVLSVVVFHAFPNSISGGFIGVDVFFVISGYLISTIIFQNLDQNTFSFSEFYSRRVKRIFPALLLVLSASYVFGWFALLGDEHKQLGKHIAAGASFISNFVLWSEAGYFDNSAETKPLLHLWSLGIEEQFYIIWPLILWFSWRKGLNLLTIVLCLVVVSFYLNHQQIKTDAVATFYSPQTRFWELLCGSLLAWGMLYKRCALTPVKSIFNDWLAVIIYRDGSGANGKTLSNIFSFAGLALLTYGFFTISKDFSFPGVWAIIPVLGAILIICAGPGAWFNHAVLSNKLVVWLGLISYPLYLWHWPLLSFARVTEGGTPSVSIRIFAVALSVVLAWLTYSLIERPLRKIKQRNAHTIVLIALMGIVGTIGYITYSRDGFSSIRFKDSELSIINATLPKYSSEYTPLIFNRLTKSEFDLVDARIKILIIGDSYAQDLVNALHEARFDSSIQMSTRIISKRCGNLFIDKTKLIKFIADKDLSFCKDKEIFEDTALRQRMLTADEVWMASSWEPWQAELIEESVNNLMNFTKKPVKVFGRKNIGKIDPRVLLKLGVDERYQIKNSVPPVQTKVNKKMKAVLSSDIYIDVQDIICNGNVESCSPFSEEGKLISYDGTHLTKDGAIMYGKKLKVHPLLRKYTTKE